MVGEQGIAASRPQVEQRFDRVLKQGAVLAVLCGLPDVAAAILLSEPALLLIPGTLAVFAALSLWARRELKRGRMERAAIIVAHGIVLTVMVSAIARPQSYPALVIASLLASLIVLPYVRGAWLRRVLATVWVLIVAVASWGLLPGAVLVGVDGVRAMASVGGIGAAAYLCVALIWQFSRRLWETVDDEKGARALAAAAEARASFLAAASAALSRSLDLRATIAKVADLAVPMMADWCTITVFDERGLPVRAAVRHADPAQQRALEDSGAWVFGDVLATGQPSLHGELTDEVLSKVAGNEAQLAALRAVGAKSSIAVPLKSHGRLIGAMSCVRSTTGTAYGEVDLLFVEELAYRSAMAMENARLYEDARLAVQVRDDFLTVAGHEMRTPLAALQLQVQTLLRASARGADVETPQLEQRLTRVSNSAQRLGRLVNELLDVSRITAGRLELQPEPVDLAALSKEVVSRFAEQAQRVGTELLLQAPDSLLGRWDRMRLEQVLSNLIENGLKYGRRQPVEIALSRVDGHAVLRVRDRGIGIAQKSQQRIFERFERAVQDKHYGGLGLGLWIVRQVVEASGGKIEVQSEEGEGATFTVALPLETPAPKQAQA